MPNVSDHSKGNDDAIRFQAEEGKTLPAIPKSMVADVLALSHTLFGHFTVGATLQVIRTHLHWPAMVKDTRDYVLSSRVDKVTGSIADAFPSFPLALSNHGTNLRWTSSSQSMFLRSRGTSRIHTPICTNFSSLRGNIERKYLVLFTTSPFGGARDTPGTLLVVVDRIESRSRQLYPALMYPKLNIATG